MSRVRLEWVSRSEAATNAFGRQLAAGLLVPLWIGLHGPLGAGKTRLVQGLARGFGYSGRVRSPSFVLENRYEGSILLRHQDLYRLEEPDDEMVAGWEEDPESVFLVEWAERTDEAPERSLTIRIEPEDESVRRLSLEWRSETSILGDLDLGRLTGVGQAPEETLV